MKTIKYTLVLIGIMIAQWAHAQVKGTLQDEQKQAIINAQVYLNNGLQTRSNANGEFEFKGILPGTYTLFVQIQEQLLSVKTFTYQKSGETMDLGILLIAKNIQLKEATITDQHVQRNMERMPEVRDNVIYAGKKNEVVRLSSASANLAQNNSRQIFSKVPGVQVWESDGSGVQMGIATRGLSPNRMWEFNTRQNGYDIASDPFGYPEAYYTPSVESLDRIEVIRGAASLQFGPQFGGMVNYIKKQSISNRKVGVESVQTFGSNGLFSSFNAVGGTIGKFNYYTNINYRKSDGWRNNNSYETINGYIHLGYRINKKMKLSAEYTKMHQLVKQPGGLTDSLFAIDPKMSLRERNWFNLNWNIAAINFDYSINNNQQLNVKVFGLAGYRNSIGYLAAINTPDAPDANGIYKNRRLEKDAYTNYGAEIRHLSTYKIGNQKQSLAFGVRYFNGNTDRIRNEFGDRGMNYSVYVENPANFNDLKYHTENMAAFAENLFRITSRWTVTPGLRYEHLKNTGKGIASNTVVVDGNSQRNFYLAGLGTEYKINSGLQAYANVSQAYRPVLFSDLTPSSTDSIDANLKDSKGYNADLGVRGSYKKLISYDASLFYLSYQNRVGTYALSSSRNYKTNIGTSVSKGVEAYVEVTPTALFDNLHIGNINLFASLSFIDASYTSWNDPDQSKTLKGKEVENSPDQIHRYGITWQYHKFSTSFQGSYVGGTYSDAKNTQAPSANGQVGYIPSYKVFDWSFQLKFKYNIQLNGGINNLANTAYFTRRGGGYPGPGLLPAEGRTWYLGLGIRL